MSERVHEDRASGSIAYLQQTDAKDFSRLLRVNRRTKDKETAEKNEGNHASTGLHDYLSDHSIRSRQHIWRNREADLLGLSLIHISEPTRQAEISYAVFCLKKKK